MSKLRVLLVGTDEAELDRIASLLEKAGHSVLPLETVSDASEALGLQRFDAVLLPESTPEDQLAAFATALRQGERGRGGDDRTVILIPSGEATNLETGITQPTNNYADALVPNYFDPPLIAQMVERVRFEAVQNAATSASKDTEALEVFDQQGFRELLGNNRELLDEIIGLFLGEAGSQMLEMETSLGRGDFTSLAKIAHTIKGSLGTLHAHRARSCAQGLEIAATRRMEEESQRNLECLRGELHELLPLVERMRTEL